MKFKLTNETKTYNGKTLHRIECVTPFGNIMAGEKGGWVAGEKNLSQDGNAWVYDDAQVYGNAQVCDDALVYGNAQVCDDARVCGNVQVCDNAQVCGNARVYGNAQVCDDARVYDNAQVYGNAQVCDDARVYDDADYIVFKNNWSSGRYFTWTKSNNMWKVGCFHGTGEELIAKAYKDSENSGKHYEAYVKLVETLQNL